MLNQAQQKAVCSTEGRLLVLAGAGSGKTRVIVHRIAHLIRERGVPPSAILGLTFTNKAAAEMRERVQSLIGAENASLVTLSTFHSFCMQVLRKEIGRLGYTRDFSLYNESDMDRVVKQLAREMLGHEGEMPSLASTKAKIYWDHSKSVKNPTGESQKRFLNEPFLSEAAAQAAKLTPADSHFLGGSSISQNLQGAEPPTWHDQFSKDLHERLQSTLRAYNAVSFDHLITLTIRLFEEHPEVLGRYQDRFRYLMIDEYQDTNPPQFRLAELLAAKFGNLCVVGDDDQSIYGWRGAEVSHILHFKAEKSVKLEQNYRSTPSILDAANAVIAHNKNRHEKKLWCSERPGEPIEVFNAPTDAEEAAGVIARLVRFREKEGLKWRDMAILYRSNALSRQFEIALLQASWQKGGHWVRGIPYEVFGGLEFSERSEIKDLLAYLRVIANDRDEEAMLRIINVPRRGISDALLDELTQTNRAENAPLWKILEEVASNRREFRSHPRGVSGIRSFVSLIGKARARFAEKALAETLVWFLEEIQYKKAIEEEVKSEKMRLFKWENVEECVSALSQYEQESIDPTLSDFIATTALGKPTFSEKTKGSEEDKVQLMTLHSAKGLEFPACFIVGLEDHILPHEKSMAATGIEEERRLFYVGITRARKFLTLSMARSRVRMGKAQPTSPSRFLFEIPKHLLKATSHK